LTRLAGSRTRPHTASGKLRTMPLPGERDEAKAPLELPAGVTAVAVVFLLAAAYLASVGLTMLAKPGLVSMAVGADLLGGLETAGPYMFLLMAGVGLAIALGLLRRHNWTRRAAIIIAMIGFVFLIPTVSSAVVSFHFAKLARSGFGLMVRVVIVFYLYQVPVREFFCEGK
jgi:hypothetical protein